MKPNEQKDSAYKQAGVDIEAGAALVERIKPHVKKTRRKGVMSGLGGFGALFDLKETGYTDPVLVSATDGVGTKLKIAIDMNRHDTVGIDLVAMCVNDLIVQGAEPLFFLDYFATGHLSVNMAEDVIAGIAEGCEQAGCALIGGETAEMPGMYAAEDYDIAGFTVGAVERDGIITGENIASGDIILGLASNGVHSNGFSLVRKLVASTQGFGYNTPSPFEGGLSLGELLLIPTRIYVKPLLKAIQSVGGIKGMAHITGGGFLENVPRVLPKHVKAQVDANSWELPPLFKWLKTIGSLSNYDLSTTLNCGIGMIVVCEADKAAEIEASLKESGETVYNLGVIAGREGDEEQIEIANVEQAWAV